MAISFNFNSSSNSSPVKETQYKCNNCLHCHKLSKNIFRCNINLDFIFDNEEPHCKYKQFKLLKQYERSVCFSFCTLQIVDGIYKYGDTGLALILDTTLSDYDILNNVINNENIIRNSTYQLSKIFNGDNVVFSPILTFERFKNESDGNTKLHCISNVLSLEESITGLNNLNKNNN